MHYQKWLEKNADKTPHDYIAACHRKGWTIDFSYANLYWAELEGVDLSGVLLVDVCLIGANLRGANLHGANLPGAYLWGSDLSGANLINANLTRANLSGANLSGANLTGANLSSANLWRAVLTGTIGLFSTQLLGLSTRNGSVETLLTESGRVDVKLGCHKGTLSETLGEIRSAEYIAKVGKEQSDLYAMVVAVQHYATTGLLQKRGVEITEYRDRGRVHKALLDLIEIIVEETEQ